MQQLKCFRPSESEPALEFAARQHVSFFGRPILFFGSAHAYLLLVFSPPLMRPEPWYSGRFKRTKSAHYRAQEGSDLRNTKKRVEKLLDREDFARPLWLVADEYGYDESNNIVVKEVGEYIYTRPLEDPDLFLSFARLWARGEPSRRSVLSWVNKHGLLTLEHPDRLLFGPDGGVNQAPIALEKFRKEALMARSALDLYANLYEGGLKALKNRIHALRDDYLEFARPLSELDRYFVDYWGEVSDDFSWSDNTLLFVAAIRLEGFVLSRVKDVRLGFWGELGPWEPSRAYKPVQSWRCPDLRSCIYLQFYFLMTDALPMRRCLNPACEMPFPATRRDKRVCNRSCRSNLRHYPHLQQRR
jgi:hypothetical protein